MSLTKSAAPPGAREGGAAAGMPIPTMKCGLQRNGKRDALKDFLEGGFAYVEDCLERRDPIDFCGQDELRQTMLHYLGKVPEEEERAAAALLRQMVRRFRDHERHPEDLIEQIGWLQKSKRNEDFIDLAIHRRTLWAGVRGSIPLASRVSKLLEHFHGDMVETAKVVGVTREGLAAMHRVNRIDGEEGPEGCVFTPKQYEMVDEALRIALTPMDEKRRGLQRIYEGVRERLKEYARVAARPALVSRTAPDLIFLLHLLYSKRKGELSDDLVEKWYWRARRSTVSTITETHLQFRNTEESLAQRKSLVVQSLLLDRFTVAEAMGADLLGFSITGSSIAEREYPGGKILSGRQLGSPAGDFAYCSREMLKDLLPEEVNFEELMQKTLYFQLTPKQHPQEFEIFDSHLPEAQPLATSPLVELDHHPRANPKHNNAYNTRPGTASTILLLFSSKYNTEDQQGNRKDGKRLPFPFYEIHTELVNGAANVRNARHLRAHLSLHRTQRHTPDLTPVEVFTEVGSAAEDLLDFVSHELLLVDPIRTKVSALEEPRACEDPSCSDEDDGNKKRSEGGNSVESETEHYGEETDCEEDAVGVGSVGSDDEEDVDSDDDADRAAAAARHAISGTDVTANGEDPKLGTIRVRLYGGLHVERRNVFLGLAPPKGTSVIRDAEATQQRMPKKKLLRRPWTHEGDAEAREEEMAKLEAAAALQERQAADKAERLRREEEGHPYYLTRTRNRIYVMDVLRINFEYIFSAIPPPSGHLRGIVGYIDLMYEKQRKLLYRGVREEETNLYYREDSTSLSTASEMNVSTKDPSSARRAKSVEVGRSDPRVVMFFPGS